MRVRTWWRGRGVRGPGPRRARRAEAGGAGGGRAGRGGAAVGLALFFRIRGLWRCVGRPAVVSRGRAAVVRGSSAGRPGGRVARGPAGGCCFFFFGLRSRQCAGGAVRGPAGGRGFSVRRRAWPGSFGLGAVAVRGPGGGRRCVGFRPGRPWQCMGWAVARGPGGGFGPGPSAWGRGGVRAGGGRWFRVLLAGGGGFAWAGGGRWFLGGSVGGGGFVLLLGFFVDGCSAGGGQA